MSIFDPNWQPYIWIGIGILLMIGEFLIPGTFVIFIGFGALVTGILSIFFQLSLMSQIFIMSVTTGLAILFGSAFINKFFPSTVTKDMVDIESYRNEIVPVVADILVNRKGGRVRYQGTDWDAYTTMDRIPVGEKVRILSRDGISFVVEPIDYN